MAAFLDDFRVKPELEALWCQVCDEMVCRVSNRSLDHLIEQAAKHRCQGLDVDFTDPSVWEDDDEVPVMHGPITAEHPLPGRPTPEEVKAHG